MDVRKMTLTPFHIAVQVRDIEEAREFYGQKMGFPKEEAHLTG
jgi:extradiol dioxygenase family protein